MRRQIAIGASKLSRNLTQLIGQGGTALPGLVAEKLHPTILKDLAGQNFPNGSIIITGTNGKTTTARFVASILTDSGTSFIHNKAGSNLQRGLIASILEQSNLRGKTQAQMGLFEVDEAFVPMVCRQLQPKIVVVTNLFRDQLDRYGEIDSTAKKFLTAFQQLEKTTFLLNADDPLVASIGLQLSDKKRVKYFGISDYKGPKLVHDYTADTITSPITGDVLQYSQRYFGHMGIYSTKNRKFKRPQPDIEVLKVKQVGLTSMKFSVAYSKKAQRTQSLEIGLPGLYNVYNAVAAFAIGMSLGIDSKKTATALKHSQAAFGRVEKLGYKDRSLYLLLIKNPTGFNQIIQTFLKPKPRTPLLVIINDNYADGRDVSWLWDSALEDIADYKGPVIVSGVRAYDMALRLKYARIDQYEIEPDIQSAIEKIVSKTSKRQTAYILPTYTAMLEARKYLVKNTKAEDFWQ